MSPRPYQLGKRQDQIDESRRRMIAAARSLLADEDNHRSFTIEAVAKQAGVAKATVYYQFGSKPGLLEAVCDALAADGGMSDLPAAFSSPEPLAGLRALVGVFTRFWAADRVLTRRLRALAALDLEVGAVIASRDQRRRSALEVIVGRLLDGRDQTPPPSREQLVRTLWMLTSFETFDALAGHDRPLADAIDEAIGLVEAVLRADLIIATEDGAEIDD